MEGSLAKSLWLLPTVAYLFSFYPNSKYGDKFSSADIREAYDYIIIGGGTAGSILANRLSDNPLESVLLLEAGGEEPYEVQVPALAPYLQQSNLDWLYKTAPSSTSCLAMMENRCNLPRGKVLGGSSSINFLLYVRGNKKDYDHWEELGNPGWAFGDVLPYFKKSEDNQDKEFAQDEDFHGIGGYQKIQKPRWKTVLANTFLEGGKEMGYSTQDINAGNQTGFMHPQGSSYKGSRFSNSRSFLDPVEHRKNLKIRLDALVTKILFDESKRATSVVFELLENQNFTVKAHKEIILTAGAFGSPHLLMLSGIGPEEHLRKFGVKPLVSLAVGRNLQDHVAGQQIFIIDKPISLKRSRLESFASIYQYVVWGTGPLTTFGGIEGIGFVNTKYSNATLQWPDIQFQFVSGSFASDKRKYLYYTLNLKEEYWDNYFNPISDLDAFTIVVKLMRPRSKGYIELESANPKQMPKIVPNYLTEPYDLVVLSEGLKLARTLGSTKAFKRLGTKLYNKPLPGCEGFRPRSAKYWECYLRHMTLTIYHYSGTTKMGPYWDPEAVVDPQLRVYGTSGLRVADASIFPTIPTGNINAAVMMVAEKAADMIKTYWQGRRQDLSTPETVSGKTSNETSSTLPELPTNLSHLSKREAKVDPKLLSKEQKVNKTDLQDSMDRNISQAKIFLKLKQNLNKTRDINLVVDQHKTEYRQEITKTYNFFTTISPFNQSTNSIFKFLSVLRNLVYFRNGLYRNVNNTNELNSTKNFGFATKAQIRNSVQSNFSKLGSKEMRSMFAKLGDIGEPSEKILERNNSYNHINLIKDLTTDYYNSSQDDSKNWDTEHEDL